MNMENFITGFPGTETLQRAALGRALGEEGARRFFDRFLDVFFGDEDAAFIASLGLRPFELKEEGFWLLDRAIDRCARHGLYTVIDLHALPGCQNQRWHSDNPTHRAFFWAYRHFQDRGTYVDRDAIERTFLARTEYMRRTGTPIWVGEFGPVYPGDARRDAMRRQVLTDQLEIYRRHDAGWALWTYKDIGLQGLVCASADSPCARRIRPVLERKARLGVDMRGARRMRACGTSWGRSRRPSAASFRASTRFRSVSAPGSTASSATSCWPSRWSRTSGAASKGWAPRRREPSRTRSGSLGA